MHIYLQYIWFHRTYYCYRMCTQKYRNRHVCKRCELLAHNDLQFTRLYAMERRILLTKAVARNYYNIMCNVSLIILNM